MVEFENGVVQNAGAVAQNADTAVENRGESAKVKEIRDKVKAGLSMLEGKEKEIAGTASGKIEFVYAYKAILQTKYGDEKETKNPCAVRLKNLDKSPIQVPVINYTKFGDTATADFNNIGSRTVGGGKEFVLTLPEFGFFVQNIAYLGQVTGGNKAVGFSFRETNKKYPTPMLIGCKTADGNTTNPLDGTMTLKYTDVLASEDVEFASMRKYFVNPSQTKKGNRGKTDRRAAINAISYAQFVKDCASSDAE